MKIAVQALHKYLAPNNNWIYNQFTNFKYFDYIIVANSYQDPEIFPIEKGKLYLFPKMKYGELPLFQHLFRAIVYRIFVKTGLDNCCFYFALRNKEVSIIHAHFANNAYKYLGLIRKLKVPFVISFYGYDYEMLPRQFPIWKSRYQELFHAATAIICEGEYGKKQLIKSGCPSEKIYVNHLGIDVEKIPFKIRKWSIGETIRFCQIASFVQKKGHEYTIKAFASFLNHYPNAHLTLIGSGQLLPDIKKLAESLRILEKVDFIDFVPYHELYHELMKYHLFIHPSVTADDGDCEGGAPVILLDAQATGLPVISTFHCDIPEEVIHGKSGYLVQEKNVKQLEEMMEEFVEKPALIRMFGEYGRKHVELNYNVLSCSQNLETIYENIMIGHKE
ncbi:glycosyltransferase [bacterium]|nr:glycosyltransferase [bacterium]MBU1873970.1 glycosyltransferase [bacterium]